VIRVLFAKTLTRRVGMESSGCAKVLSNDFAILARPEKKEALKASKEKAKQLIIELQKAREIDPQQLREPCSL
jgi:hypothetical protein